MKYSLTIQHEEQKVSYLYFTADNIRQAKIKAGELLTDYKSKKFFLPSFPVASANFTGLKPAIKEHWLSVWVNDDQAVNAWGLPCGGRWKTVK